MEVLHKRHFTCGFHGTSSGQTNQRLLGKPTCPVGGARGRGMTSRTVVLTGAFPFHLSFLNSRSSSPLYMDLHPTYPKETWNLATHVENWELKDRSTGYSHGLQSSELLA